MFGDPVCLNSVSALLSCIQGLLKFAQASWRVLQRCGLGADCMCACIYTRTHTQPDIMCRGLHVYLHACMHVMDACMHAGMQAWMHACSFCLGVANFKQPRWITESPRLRGSGILQCLLGFLRMNSSSTTPRFRSGCTVEALSTSGSS